MRELLLLRHAKSSWNDSSLPDHDRPLNDRGRRDGPRMGVLIRELDLLPDLVLCSPAIRARQTWALAGEAAGSDAAVRFVDTLYAASPRTLIEAARAAADDARRVLLIAHNPGLEELMRALCGEDEDFSTAALAHIEAPIDRWRDLTLRTSCRLVGFWRPKEIGGNNPPGGP